MGATALVIRRSITKPAADTSILYSQEGDGPRLVSPLTPVGASFAANFGRKLNRSGGTG